MYRMLGELRRTSRDRQAGGGVPPGEVVALDAALILEANWDEFCDRIIYVEAPGGVGLERAKERGWSAEQYAAREAAQMPLERKRERADIVLDNSDTTESLRTEVQRVWLSLRA